MRLPPGVLEEPFAVSEAGRAPIRAARSTDDSAQPSEPLFDPKAIRFARFLESDPPERKWILRAGDDGVLPLGVVGLLAAMGGGGKSMLAYQLGFSIATGIPFLGMEIGAPGAFLYLAAEDDELELHRRGHVLLQHYERLAERAGKPLDRGAVSERFYILSRVADENLLTRLNSDGEVRRTKLGARLQEAAAQIPDLRMIVIDPVSRFRGGRANYEEDATRFVEVLEEIREHTGATVLGLSHVSQAGIRGGGGQEMVRGSTGLVDGVRWVATLQRPQRPQRPQRLQRLQRDKAAGHGIMEEEAGRYLRLEVPKSNYAPPFPGMWLLREAGGVLVPTKPQLDSSSEEARKADREYPNIVARLQSLLLEKSPMTRTAIRRYSGRTNQLQAGDKTVREVIERAVRDGDLLEVKGKLVTPMKVER